MVKLLGTINRFLCRKYPAVLCNRYGVYSGNVSVFSVLFANVCVRLRARLVQS